jgi:hypothetical protein
MAATLVSSFSTSLNMSLRNILSVPALLLTVHTCAQDWTGALDSDWNNPGNWDQWPLTGENVTIDPDNYIGAAASPIIMSGAVFTPDRVFVENGGTLTISANLSVADRMIISGPSVVIKTAGNFTTDRLIIGDGGRFEQQGATGTMEVITVLAIADGDVNAASTFLMSTGNLVILGELGFECELGDHDPEFRMTGGLAAVNGDVVWFGASPGSGTPRLLIEGGSIDLNGNVTNTTNSTVDLFIHIANDANVEAYNSTFMLPHASDSLVMIGGALRLLGSTAIDNDGVVQASGGDVYAAGTNELNGSGLYRFGNVTIDTAGQLNHVSPATIEVQGEWVDLGTFQPQQNTVAFTGDAFQLITGSGFHNLCLASTGLGAHLTGPVEVSGLLDLQDGALYTQANDLLILLPGASAVANSIGSFVNGPMKKIGNTDFVFPVGDYGTLRPIGVYDINDQDTEITAEAAAEMPPFSTSLGIGLEAIALTGYWSLERAVTNDPVRVSLHWGATGILPTGDCDSLVVADLNGTEWRANASSTSGACDSGTGHVLSDGAFADVDRFAFGVAGGPVGIEDEQLGPQIVIFPNPAGANVLFKGISPNAKIEVIDTAGKLVFSEFAKHGIDVSAWPEGIYAVRSSYMHAVRLFVQR